MNAFLLRLLINSVALVASAAAVNALADGGVLPGRIILRGANAIVVAAIVFGLVNALIRPLVLFVTCLINLITLGLFTIVVNGLMLLLTSWMVAMLNQEFGLSLQFHVENLLAAIAGAIFISLVSTLLTKAID